MIISPRGTSYNICAHAQQGPGNTEPDLEAMQPIRSRGWCFTINNYSHEEVLHLRDQVREDSEYLVFGRETGESGTPHLQGFIRFKNPLSLRRVKDLLPRAHLEIQRGTPYQASIYCKKDGDYEEYGETPKKPGSTQKEQWKLVVQWSESGELERIREEFPHVYFLHQRRIRELRQRRLGIMSGSLQNEWWVGPTGTGKSRHLWDMYPNHYQKSLNKWWDGYEGEDTVAIEEMSPEHGQYLGHFLKIWADRYPFSPEIKGGTIKKIRPQRIIVLSNYTIDECFQKVQDREPIKRRFKVVHFPTSIFPSDDMVESLLSLSQ